MRAIIAAAPMIEPQSGNDLAGRPPRAALRVIQLGAVAVVAAVSAHFPFELDRFFVPKELALHLTAVLAGLLLIRAIARTPAGLIDLLLVAFVLLGGVSAVVAINPWLGGRALAITASAVALFWSARALREAGLARPLLGGLAFAVVLIAAGSLMQAYGVETLLFSMNRAPGGTLGNRNFVAHAGAFGFPLLLHAALRAPAGMRFFLPALGAGVVAASLVLTRSRGAWLAFAAVMAISGAAMLGSAALRRDGRLWGRLIALAVFCAAGVVAALVIPNTLQWRSDNPYLDSVQRIADYEEGSGRGRLIQYERSLRMAVASPLVGVGPGNWPVEYARYASRRDPSMNGGDPGMTFNPWPSSDWVAWAAERGLAAVVLFGITVALLFLSALRRLRRAASAEEALEGMALAGMIAGAVVAGAFDAVLLLALPAFLVFAALGALAPPAAKPHRGLMIVGALLIVLLSGAGAARSTAQLVAMELYSRGDRRSLSIASQIDPGNFRVRLRAARNTRGQERCRHARAATALFPSSEAAAALARGCR